MGFLKRIKDMKHMVAETPGLIAQTTQLGANAQAMADAQRAAATTPVAMAAATDAASATGDAGGPIAGVSLELYVTISRSLATVGYDTARAPEMAAREGVSAADWDVAVAGWNARMHTDPTVAQRFNALYTGR